MTNTRISRTDGLGVSTRAALALIVVTAVAGSTGVAHGDLLPAAPPQPSAAKPATPPATAAPAPAPTVAKPTPPAAPTPPPAPTVAKPAPPPPAPTVAKPTPPAAVPAPPSKPTPTSAAPQTPGAAPASTVAPVTAAPPSTATPPTKPSAPSTGAPPTSQSQGAPAAPQAPATRANEAPTALQNTAPASGGGNGPHGALPIDQQMVVLGSWIGNEPKVERPASVSPAFWTSLIPADNPGTAAQVALGKRLYFDARLSKDGTVSCATCHDTSRGFTDRRSTSEGVSDKLGRRNAPTTMNARFFATLFWDGRAGTLEEQAKLPILNPIEMAQADDKAVLAAIGRDPAYAPMFQSAYGRAPTYDDVGRAIAAFERTLVFLSAPFDRFAVGQPEAISADARAGFALFHGKARCASCHQISSSNPIGTDNQFHNIGVSARHQNFETLAKQALEALQKNPTKEAIDQLSLQTDLAELGRFVVTRNRSDIGAFKTQQVRNVGVTAPYMHDGSMPTLWDVVDHYNRGGEANPYLDGGIEPLNLTDKEVDQVVAFLFTLTDDRLADQNRAEFARQRQIAAARRPFKEPALATRAVLPFEQRLSSTTAGKP